MLYYASFRIDVDIVGEEAKNLSRKFIAALPGVRLLDAKILSVPSHRGSVSTVFSDHTTIYHDLPLLLEIDEIAFKPETIKGTYRVKVEERTISLNILSIDVICPPTGILLHKSDERRDIIQPMKLD